MLRSHKRPILSSLPRLDAAIGHSRDNAGQVGSLGSGGDRAVYAPNIYAPQAQGIYFKGYENAPGEWDEYPPYVNAEGFDIGSPGIYSDNPSLVFHTGYGYSPQVPYGPYSPVTTPLPSVRGDAQLYSPQQYTYSGPPYYQQLVPPNMQYISSPTPVSQPQLNSLMNVDQQVDGMLLGQRPGYSSSLGSFGGNFSGNPGNLGFHDMHQGFDAFRSGGLWSDWPKPSDRQRSLTPLPPAVSPQMIGTLGSFGQNVGMASPQPRSFYGFGSGSNSYSRGHLHGGFNQGSSFGSESISSLGTNTRGWLSLDNGRRGKSNGSLCNCSGTIDILSEQNRGPRASKPKSLIANENSLASDGNKQSLSTAKTHDGSYNHPDFVTEYEDAKFFIIKSYSEDNVHKSIKYGVWASTPNGNRKLDAAYGEAKEKQSTCPIFLLFSVNASAQFCGVAEMVGPVDFDKSVDYWQQDKWSGQFPVKWHIVKDVPNSHFRHIVLENNDNKPVTNSRDTQEVKLEQGIEMLKIFKNYETDTSILDDFAFYDDRQKAIQERKARQQASLVGVGGNEHGNVVTLSNDFIKKMSKSFAQVVQLEECGKEASVTVRAGSAPDGSVSTRVELDHAVNSSGVNSSD
ncbi:YTH domain-containing protein ECT4 isoform X2 [Cornus florida]|uniref:YTH domain-containing protein ECT4 isoform X2 n=1 Tax=Cornus florida TaxID=4283 RepID=UPI00289CD40A|nr:YTH domain-containing protein ECT4 isoform X2 [Cornus florida]